MAKVKLSWEDENAFYAIVECDDGTLALISCPFLLKKDVSLEIIPERREFLLENGVRFPQRWKVFVTPNTSKEDAVFILMKRLCDL